MKCKPSIQEQEKIDEDELISSIEKINENLRCLNNEKPQCKGHDLDRFIKEELNNSLSCLGLGILNYQF